MKAAEEEADLYFYFIDVLNFFLLISKVTVRPCHKIGVNASAV